MLEVEMETINNARHSVSVTHQFHSFERLTATKLSSCDVVCIRKSEEVKYLDMEMKTSNNAIHQFLN